MNVMLCLVWYDCLDLWGCVFKLKIDCDHNAQVLLEWDVECYLSYFIYKFLLYISLFMVSLPLFVCLCLWCMCNDRI